MFQRVIGLGASQVIVPGIFPMGCLPGILEDFKSNDKSAYDEHQCLKEFNNFVAFHNNYLQKTIITLQAENPHTTIVYADYFNAFKWILYNAPRLGNCRKLAIDRTCELRARGIHNMSSARCTKLCTENLYIMTWQLMR